jgi:predicted lipoprotein with Yx(FWY)xxD motif
MRNTLLVRLSGAALNWPPIRSKAWTVAAACLLAMSMARGSDAPTGWIANLPYPEAVALIKETPIGWTYRQSGTDLPLYISDADKRGKSSCNDTCVLQWDPLLAPDHAKTIGDWSAIRRKDGRFQWAYRGRAVYTHIHDTPQAPNGDGVDGIWHLMLHFQ